MEEEAPQQEKKGPGMMVAVVIVVLVIVLGVAGYVIYKSSKKAAMVPAPTPTQAMMKKESPTPAETGSMMMEQKITITGSNFSFSPNSITAKKGQKVTVTFKSGGGFHNFAIDEFNVKTDVVGTGKSVDVTFTPDKTGTFEFYCAVGNHRAMGMVGKLIVQ